MANKPINNMTLTFNYTGGNWIFSINNATVDLKAMVDKGYLVQLQVIRYIGRAVPSMFAKGATKEEPTESNIKKTNALFENISTAVAINPASINLSSFMSDLLQGDQDTIYGKSGAAEFWFNTYGRWFRRYKFCVTINNTEFVRSDDLWVYTYYNGTVDFQDVDMSLDGNELNVYPL